MTVEINLYGFKPCLKESDNPTYGFVKCETFRIFGVEIKTKSDFGVANKGSFGIVLPARIYDIKKFSD